MSPPVSKLNRIPSYYKSPRLDRRLLLVSNRLPVTVKRSDEGKYELSMSSGGLVAAVSGLSKTTSFVWFGWPGLSVPENEIGRLSKQLHDEYRAIPVLMEESLAEKHYNGFSNSVLWPLFHYHPSEVHFDDSTWESYQAANRIFAKEIAKNVESGDLVWVHDYHLMLLPQMLREELGNSKKDVKIGFFLHTPFPSSEIYRMLPVREQVLEGVLHSDLIGFHTFDYARHFLNSCQKLLHLPITPNCVRFGGGSTEIAVFPVGIDPGKFHDKLEDPKVQDRVSLLRAKFEGVKVLVGIDRLDYTKGLPQKLHALECLFEQHPETVGKVALIQIAVPSRETVEDYRDLRAVVNETVGRINGRYGTIDYMPVHFVYRSVPFDELVALYALADGCLVTPTRDGMNLVCYEYIASQKKSQGILMVSEFAGAAESLDGCVLLNPWDVEAVADVIHQALQTQDETRSANFQKLHRYIEKYTSELWGRSFVRALARTVDMAEHIY